jgi:hypothetical protein
MEKDNQEKEKSYSINDDYEDFEKRTNFPSRASKSTLETFGAELLSSSKPFDILGEPCRVEQIAYRNQDGKILYTWKRTVPIKSKSDEVHFHIYKEMTEKGPLYFKSE